MAIETRVRDVFLADVLKKARQLSAKGFSPEFGELGRFFRQRIRDGFVQEVDPYGNPWPALARSTVRDKVRRGVANPQGILKDSGALANSFEYRVTVNGVRVFSNRVFDDGVDANIHQTGGIHPVGRNNIPQRMMVPDADDLPPDWADEIERQIGNGIDRLFS